MREIDDREHHTGVHDPWVSDDQGFLAMDHDSRLCDSSRHAYGRILFWYEKGKAVEPRILHPSRG